MVLRWWRWRGLIVAWRWNRWRWSVETFNHHVRRHPKPCHRLGCPPCGGGDSCLPQYFGLYTHLEFYSIKVVYNSSCYRYSRALRTTTMYTSTKPQKCYSQSFVQATGMTQNADELWWRQKLCHKPFRLVIKVYRLIWIGSLCRITQNVRHTGRSSSKSVRFLRFGWCNKRNKERSHKLGR